MDILISSNIERLLYMLSNEDTALVRAYMDALKEVGTYTVNSEIKSKIAENFFGGFADEEACAETIRETYQRFGYVVDPHTAVAVAVHNAYTEKTGDHTKTIIASTASPFKFNGAVLDALCGESLELDEFDLLEKLANDYGLEIPQPLKVLKEKAVRFETVCDKDNMKETVNAFLK